MMFVVGVVLMSFVAVTIVYNPTLTFDQRIIGVGIIAVLFVLLIGGSITCSYGRAKIHVRGQA